jgi:polyphenol oxidase
VPTSFRETPDHVLQVVPWLRLPWLEHGFGSRLSEDWNRIPSVSLKQIHSDICIKVTSGQGIAGEGDALLTDVPGLRIAVRTADCVPIILADAHSKTIAVVHAGWRGTVRGIASKAVAAMRSHFGSTPGAILAAIGPAIGPCCYEVGGEVAVQFQDVFPERSDLAGKTFLDLAEANRRQLLRSGVQDDSISVAGLCTCCSTAMFHSWRRSRTDGRMWAAAAVK